MIDESQNIINVEISSENMIETNIEGKGDPGPQGKDGITYIPEIENVESIDSDKEAEASVRTEGNHMYFSFKIPRGKNSLSTGDMHKSDYDKDGDRIIDKAYESTKIGNYTKEVLDENFSNFNSSLASAIENLKTIIQNEKNVIVEQINGSDMTFEEKINGLNFELLKFDNWVVKKYNNGYVEMYHTFEKKCNLDKTYGNAYWTEIASGTFPIELVELISIHTSVHCKGHILTTSYSNISNTSYSLFVADLMQSYEGNVNFNTAILGRWKDLA